MPELDGYDGYVYPVDVEQAITDTGSGDWDPSIDTSGTDTESAITDIGTGDVDLTIPSGDTGTGDWDTFIDSSASNLPRTADGGIDWAKLGKEGIDKVLGFFKDSNGNVDWKKVLATVGTTAGAYLGYKSNQATGSGSSTGSGYQGGIPSLTASRTKNAIPTDRRPGAGGIAYFSPMKYLGQTNMTGFPEGGTAGSTTTAPVGGGTSTGGTGGISSGATGGGYSTSGGIASGTNPGNMFGETANRKIPTDRSGVIMNGDPKQEVGMQQLLDFFKQNPIKDTTQLAQLYNFAHSMGISNLGVAHARALAKQELGIDTYNLPGGVGDDPNGLKFDALVARAGMGNFHAPTAQAAAPAAPSSDDVYNAFVNMYGKNDFVQQAQNAMKQYGLSQDQVSQLLSAHTLGGGQAANQFNQAMAGNYTPLPTPSNPAQSSPNAQLNNWQAYVNQYQDLQNAGINTQEAAQQHWQNYGMNEGRQYFAAGGGVNKGIAALAPQKGRLLRGPGDGVSDSIPATINGKQPARLADGEFVIPARIVSELGNGSTEAGSRKLYAMLDRIEKARHRNKVPSKDTRADKHLPA